MKKEKLAIAVFSALVLAAILFLTMDTAPRSQNSALPVMLQAGAENLHLWQGEDGSVYGFLPGHVSPAEAVILAEGVDGAALDGQLLPLSCGALTENREYTLSWQENGDVCRRSFFLLTGRDTATMYLDTQSGSMDYIHQEKGNAERGSLRLYDEQGNLNFSGSLESIQGRGNSTWVVHDKKPYNLELTEEADLLGMGAAKKWALLADAFDASGMRNKLVLDAAAQLELPYTPEGQWTEVYLNGEYAGLYLLCERLESHPQRVGLSADGALLCMDRDIRVEADTDPWFVTEHGQYLQIREGRDIGAIKEMIQSLENALLAADGTDPVTGKTWQELADLGSWVKKYLVEEVFGSYDAGFQSQYFFCPDLSGDSPVYAGPVWDFDAALGNPDIWALNSPQGLYAWRPEAMAGYPTPWYHSLYEKDQFRAELVRTYEAVFLPLLEAMSETISGYEAQIAAAYERNRIRWNVQTDGLHTEAEAITDYLSKRTAFLTDLWLEEEEFCILRLQEGAQGGYYGYYAQEPGTCFESLPEKEDEAFLGWYREDTGERFDPVQPVTEDLQLVPRYEGDAAEPQDKAPGLMDRILAVYVYVPVLALLLITGILVPLNLRRSRKSKHREYSKS